MRRAETRGLIPPPDVDDERWSEAAARELPDRVPEIRAAVSDAAYEAAYEAEHGAARQRDARASAGGDDAPGGGDGADGEHGPDSDGDPTSVRARRAAKKQSFGPHQLARELGLKTWQVRRAVLRGLLPPPDTDTGRWSHERAEALRAEADGVREVLGDHPGFGAVRAAEALARSTGLAVERADVGALVDGGLLEPADTYRGHPLYSVDALEGVPRERIAEVVGERERWFAGSVTAKEGAALLGWSQGSFEVTAERRGLAPDHHGRYAREAVAALAEGGTGVPTEAS